MSAGGGGFRYEAKHDDTSPLTQVPVDALTRDLNSRAGRVNLFKAYLWVSGGLLLCSLGEPVFFLGLLIVAGIGAFFVHRWDRDRRTARIFYDLDNDDVVERLALCSVAGEALARAARVWHIFASTQTLARRYHAGAGSLIQRTPTRCWRGSLDGVSLNVAAWSIPVGPIQLLFLPDQLLIRQGTRCWFVGYEHVDATHESSRFIEDGAVPPDGQVIDTTWRFVRNDGGPDLRFKNNHRLPVLSYGELILHCGTVRIVIQASNPAATQAAAAALQELTRLAREGLTPLQPAYPAPPRTPAAPPVSWGRSPPAAPPAKPAVPVHPTAIRPPVGWGAPTRPMGPGRPLPPPLPVLRARPKTTAIPASVGVRFVGPFEPLTVAGRTIACPITYVAPAASYDADASTIVMSLPVGVADRAMPLPYWPRYSDADPDQRAQYLDWMAGGRARPDIAVGYVFIFFYGLERRVLIDGADEDLARAEVQRLLTIYGGNLSFRRYASDFLAFSALRDGERPAGTSQAELDERLRPLAGASATALVTVLAWHHAQNRPLPAEYAAAVVRDVEGAKRSAVVTQSANELLSLFKIRYRETFGEGLLLEAAKRPLTIEYRPASPSLLELGRKLSTTVPDVLGRPAQFRRVLALWNDCVDDLRKANAKKKGAKALDAAGWAALPPELRAEYDHPDQDRWDGAVAGLPVLAGFHLATIGQLAELTGLERSERLTAAQIKRISARAADVGYATEPDGRVRAKASDAKNEVLIWRAAPTELPEPKLYAAVFAMLSLAMTVAMADGVFTDEEHEVINSFLAELFTLDDAMRVRVDAMKQLMTRDPSRLAAVAKTLRSTRTPAELAKVGAVLVAIAAADGTIADVEEKALRSLYKNLGLPPSELAAAIARTGARLARDGVVQVQDGTLGNGSVPIPPPPDAAPKLLLDHAAIEAIVADTKDVAAILAEVFDGEADEPIPQPAPSASSESRLPIPELPRASDTTTRLAQGLDVRYHAVLEELLGREEWSAADVRRVAERHRLMPAAILDTINAWSDATLGDFLIEDAGAWKINRELAKVNA